MSHWASLQLDLPSHFWHLFWQQDLSNLHSPFWQLVVCGHCFALWPAQEVKKIRPNVNREAFKNFIRIPFYNV